MTPAQVAHIMSLVEEYAGDYARATTENLYGTSKSYTKQCFEAANESRAAIEAALRDAPQQAEPTDFEHWLNARRDLRVHEVFHDLVAMLAARPSAPTAVEPDERADLIVQAGEEMSFEAWFKTMCPVDGINAKIAARAAWQARASKGTPK